MSAFCSACGTVLDIVSDHTITLTKTDSLQDAAGPSDDVQVSLTSISRGTAILVPTSHWMTSLCRVVIVKSLLRTVDSLFVMSDL